MTQPPRPHAAPPLTHDALCDQLSAGWARDEWWGRRWEARAWGRGLSLALSALAPALQPLTPSAPLSLEALEALLGPLAPTLRATAALALYGASEEGLRRRLYEELALDAEAERAWRGALAASARSPVAQETLTALSCTANGAPCPLTLSALTLLASAPASARLSEAGEPRAEGPLALAETLEAWRGGQRDAPIDAPPPLHGGPYERLVPLAARCAQGEWAEALASLNGLSPTARAALGPPAEALARSLAALTASPAEPPAPASAPAPDPKRRPPDDPLPLHAPHAPLIARAPTAGEQLGAWRLDGLISPLPTCYTWRAGRRRGSLYKEGALQWRLLAPEQEPHDYAPTTTAAVTGERSPLSDTALASQLTDLTAQPVEGLAPLLEWGWDEARALLYVIEDRLPGPSLLEAHQARPLTLGQLLSVGRALLTTLAALHARGYAHGNIKPESVLWSGRSWALCTPHLSPTLPPGARPGARLRGLWFTAPERRSRAPAPLKELQSADLYALGRLLEELRGEGLAGERPEQAAVATDLIADLTLPCASARGDAAALLATWGQPAERLLCAMGGEVSVERARDLSALIAQDGSGASHALLVSEETDPARAAWSPWWLSPKARALVRERLDASPPRSLNEALRGEVAPAPYLSLWRPDDLEGLTFRLIPPGTSRLNAVYGSAEPLWALTTPVTRDLWVSLMGTHGGLTGVNGAPVESVTWREAAQLCNALSARLGLPPAYEIAPLEPAAPATLSPAQEPIRGLGERDSTLLPLDASSVDGVTLIAGSRGARLPMVAEWVYLSLAGGVGPYAGELAPHEGIYGAEVAMGMIGAAGSRPANAWGLHDTCGLVWEWAHPDGACSVSDRGAPICGGGWLDAAVDCRATTIKRRQPRERSFEQGVRVVIPAPPQSPAAPPPRAPRATPPDAAPGHHA